VDLLPTATSADQRDRAARIAVLPVGSFEQHGDHLPLITDTIVACTIAKAIADEHHLFLLPPITISCSHEHAAFPGTVSIRAATLYSLVWDVAESLSSAGVPAVILVNGHGGNYVLSNVVQELNVAGPRAALFPAASHWNSARRAARVETNSHEDMHAGELEASLLRAFTPSLIQDGYRNDDHVANERSMLLTTGMLEYTPSGVIGRPSLARPEKGEALVHSLVAQASEVIAVLEQAK
jgi:creatinine amidohydrolase